MSLALFIANVTFFILSSMAAGYFFDKNKMLFGINLAAALMNLIAIIVFTAEKVA